MIGTHDGAVGAVLAHEPLNDLVGFFTALRIDHLHAGSMFSAFDCLSMLPAIEYDRDGMALSMAVSRQVLDERLSRHLRS